MLINFFDLQPSHPYSLMNLCLVIGWQISITFLNLTQLVADSWSAMLTSATWASLNTKKRRACLFSCLVVMFPMCLLTLDYITFTFHSNSTFPGFYWWDFEKNRKSPELGAMLLWESYLTFLKFSCPTSLHLRPTGSALNRVAMLLPVVLTQVDTWYPCQKVFFSGKPLHWATHEQLMQSSSEDKNH